VKPHTIRLTVCQSPEQGAFRIGNEGGIHENLSAEVEKIANKIEVSLSVDAILLFAVPGLPLGLFPSNSMLPLFSHYLFS
jgi:hypothetical protein